MVKNEKAPSKNISFPLALVRFVVKATLGWLSLLTVTGNAKKMAIHDMIARSIEYYRFQINDDQLLYFNWI